jgi:DNA-binding response OmpR family regulator
VATIAIFNSSEDTVEALRLAFEHQGHETVSAHIDQIKRGQVDFLDFIKTHDPKAVVYDVSPPYDHNFTFLKLLRDTQVMQGRPIILTTTHKVNLERMVGPTDAIEIIGKPYDLEQVVATAVRKLHAR